MRLFVTGASGLLGRSLMPKLEADIGDRYTSVVCWRREVFGDFLSGKNRTNALEAAKPDVVIHLAWLATGSPNYENDPDNLLWAEASIDFARESTASGLRFFGTGSMIEEEGDIRSFYAEAKRKVADDVLQGSAGKGLTAWWRPAWVFDFNELRPRVVHEYAESLKAGRSFMPVNPSSTHDFIHADDVASAMKCLVDHAAVGSWDIETGCHISVDQLLVSFDKWQGRGERHFWETESALPSPNSPPQGDGRLAALGWHPQETARYLESFWAPAHRRSLLSKGES